MKQEESLIRNCSLYLAHCLPPFSFVIQDCKMFPSVAHGFHKDVSSFFSFTTAVQYKCNEGYVLVGQSKITCRNSRWSASAPECKGNLNFTDDPD